MWRGLSQAQRVSVVVVMLLAVAGIAAFVYFSRAEYGPLYSRLDADEAAQVVAKLEALGVPYRITGGGTTIQVPQDRVYAARLQLAAEGLPRGGAGFELFDRTTFGASDVTQRVNFQRALQGELVRTIETMAEIEAARVHLALPQERLFTEAASRPSASVVVRLRPGAALSAKQIRAITHLVAGSVEGLSPDRVTVVDTRGVLLSSGQEDAGGLGAAQVAAREQVEIAIEQRLQTMLDQVLGPGRAIVRVSAEIDLSRRQVQEESFTQNSRAPRSEVSIEESYDGRGGPPGGPPGAAPAVPSYSATPAAAAGSQYRRRETRTTYDVARRVEHAVSAGGSIRRLSVAVLVDQAVPAAQMNSLRSVIAASVGFDALRRDSVVVQTAAFSPQPAPTLAAPPGPPAPPGASRGLPVVPIAAGAGAALLMLIVAIALLLRRRPPKVETLKPAPLPQVAAAPAAPAPSADEEERILAALRKRQEEQPEAAVLRREVQRLAKDRPTDAAAIVKNWITER